MIWSRFDDFDIHGSLVRVATEAKPKDSFIPSPGSPLWSQPLSRSWGVAPDSLDTDVFSPRFRVSFRRRCLLNAHADFFMTSCSGVFRPVMGSQLRQPTDLSRPYPACSAEHTSRCHTRFLFDGTNSRRRRACVIRNEHLSQPTSNDGCVRNRCPLFADIAEAHRQVPIALCDRHLIGCQVQAQYGGHVWRCISVVLLAPHSIRYRAAYSIFWWSLQEDLTPSQCCRPDNRGNGSASAQNKLLRQCFPRAPQAWRLQDNASQDDGPQSRSGRSSEDSVET